MKPSMIIRTYSCLNRNCRNEFDSERDHPPCPRCRGLRVQWVPRPVAINSSRTAAIDKTARELAADFGLTNFRTPEYGRPAVEHARPATAAQPAQNRGPMTFEPMPGWRVTLPESALSGAGAAVCAPTGVTAKIKVDPNAGPLKENNPTTGMAAMRAHTKIEGRYNAKVPK